MCDTNQKTHHVLDSLMIPRILHNFDNKDNSEL